jgi:hypothetical protein
MKTAPEYHQESRRNFAASMVFFSMAGMFAAAAVMTFLDGSAMACIIASSVTACLLWTGAVAFGDSLRAHRAMKSIRPTKHDLL